MYHKCLKNYINYNYHILHVLHVIFMLLDQSSFFIGSKIKTIENGSCNVKKKNTICCLTFQIKYQNIRNLENGEKKCGNRLVYSIERKERE